MKNLTETLAVEWGPYGIQVNGLVPGLFPHEDMTADIQGNLERTDDKDVCQPALRVGQRQRARLGGDLPRLALRPLHLRPHPRRRRRQPTSIVRRGVAPMSRTARASAGPLPCTTDRCARARVSAV